MATRVKVTYEGAFLEMVFVRSANGELELNDMQVLGVLIGTHPLFQEIRERARRFSWSLAASGRVERKAKAPTLPSTNIGIGAN